MTGRYLLMGLGSLAVLGVHCAPPAAVVRPMEQGRPIDPEVIDGFQRGVTSRTEALRVLGEPASSSTDPQDGTTILTWTYRRVDAAGTTQTLAVLQFDLQDKLLVKAVSQDSQSR